MAIEASWIIATGVVIFLFVSIYVVTQSKKTNLVQRDSDAFTDVIFQDFSGRYRVLGANPISANKDIFMVRLKNVVTGEELQTKLSNAEIIPLNNIVNMTRYTNPEYHHVELYHQETAKQIRVNDETLRETKRNLAEERADSSRRLGESINAVERLVSASRPKSLLDQRDPSQ